MLHVIHHTVAGVNISADTSYSQQATSYDGIQVYACCSICFERCLSVCVFVCLSVLLDERYSLRIGTQRI